MHLMSKYVNIKLGMYPKELFWMIKQNEHLFKNKDIIIKCKSISHFFKQFIYNTLKIYYRNNSIISSLIPAAQYLIL